MGARDLCVRYNENGEMRVDEFDLRVLDGFANSCKSKGYSRPSISRWNFLCSVGFTGLGPLCSCYNRQI